VRTGGLLLAAALSLLGIALWQHCALPLLPEPIVQPESVTAPAPNAAQAVATAMDATDTASVERAIVATDPTASTSPPSYASYVDRLVRMGLATSTLDADGDPRAAAESDQQARATMTELLERIPDAEQFALDALQDDEAPPAGDLPGQIRRQVHNVVLSLGLERRHHIAKQDPARAPALETFVAAMLALLPTSDALATELGNGQLADRPYLSLAHEPAVLQLVAMAGEHRFPAATAEALLTTLWRNLQAVGARTSDELAGLSLLLLQEGNESERRAARRRLLLDDRYRSVLLDHVRASKDRTEAKALALIAAEQLPPKTALEVLTLAVTVGAEPAAAFVVLGRRDPATLQQAYEHSLASDVEPKLRDLLVAGIGFSGEPAAIEVAKLAQQSDPDPEVRLRGMFALTANAPAALGEAAIQRALDDPQIGNDPQRLSAVVLALDNLARAGEINAIDRLGQRLRMTSGLTTGARLELEKILARALPGGRTSR
jgi:hypothetical protein